MNSEVVLDLITIARQDWVANALGTKISAMGVVDAIKNKLPEPEVDKRITLEVLTNNPQLQDIVASPLRRFIEHYANPENLQHIPIRTGLEQIIADPTARQVIEYIQGEFDKVENIIAQIGKEMDAPRLNEVRSEVQRIYESIFGYLDTIDRLANRERNNELRQNVSRKPKPGCASPREELPIFPAEFGGK
jgi:hypothetical protein